MSGERAWLRIVRNDMQVVKQNIRVYSLADIYREYNQNIVKNSD
jgi:hypothetical protein